MTEFIDWVDETYGFVASTAIAGFIGCVGVLLACVLIMLTALSQGLLLLVPAGIIIFMYFKYQESIKNE